MGSTNGGTASPSIPASGPQSVRVDSWLWAVRLTPTRAAATAACRAGHVRVRGERVKASAAVRIGDEVRLRVRGFDRIVIVRRLIVKRVGAPIAAECLTDLTPPPPPRTAVPAAPAARERGSGRPTKRERRDIERFLESVRDPFADPDPTDNRDGRFG